MYYQNDPEFFSQTLNLEESPFNFKIHLFQGHQARQEMGELRAGTLESREVHTNMLEFLDSFMAKNVDMKPIYDRSGKGQDKLRVLFHLEDKEKATALYQMVGVDR